MTDLHQQIADLEADIDALSDAAEQCRKSMIVAKMAVVGGLMILWIDRVGSDCPPSWDCGHTRRDRVLRVEQEHARADRRQD
jgi:hypothetical protein